MTFRIRSVSFVTNRNLIVSFVTVAQKVRLICSKMAKERLSKEDFQKDRLRIHVLDEVRLICAKHGASCL